MTIVSTYDHESQCLEPLATITRTTAIVTGPKWCEHHNFFFGGWNLCAVDGDATTLLQAYETEDAAVWVRDSLIAAARPGQELAVI